MFTEAYNYMTNDQPMRIHLRIEQDTNVKDIIKKISMMRECNLDATLTKTSLVIYSVDPKSRTVKTVFSSNDKLNEYDLIAYEIHCHEVICNKGRQIVRNFYKENKDFGPLYPESRLRSLLFPSA